MHSSLFRRFGSQGGSTGSAPEGAQGGVGVAGGVGVPGGVGVAGGVGVPGPASEGLESQPVLIEVEFAAYAEDCRMFGFWRYAGDRLSDALNEQAEYELHDVLVAALEDGRSVEARELLVHRDEVLAVRASGPRGNPARRTRMRPSPITLRTGPYTVHGYVHGPPGADPLQQLRRRRPMVALTEAWIEYRSAGEDHRGRVGTIIVNHDVLDWVRLSRDEEVGLPDLPAETALDPRAKDMTGYIFTPTE